MYDSENEDELKEAIEHRRAEENKDDNGVPRFNPVVLYDAVHVKPIKKDETHRLFKKNDQPSRPPINYDPDFVIWELEFTRCIQHLQGDRPDRMECTAPLYKLESQMMKDYIVHNTEYYTYTLGDMLFILYSYMICCDRPIAREVYSIVHLKTLFNKLIIISCQHTKEKLASYPTVNEIESLKSETCAFIIQHYHYIMENMVPMIEHWEGNDKIELLALERIEKELKDEEEKMSRERKEEVKEEETRYLFMSEERKKETDRARQLFKVKEKMSKTKYKSPAYLAMPGPIRFEIEKLQYRNIELLALSNDQDVRNAAGSVNENNMGYLFTQTANDLVLKLIPVANRVFFQFLLERRLSDKYPYILDEQLSAIPPTAVEVFRKWLIERCKKDCSDEFPDKYREVGFELKIPMGARMTLYRRSQTRSDATPALNIIETELGYDQAEYIGETATMKLMEVALNVNHDQYETLCIAMFNYMMGHELRIDFLGDYYVRPSMYYIYYDSFDQKSINHRPRRPLITFLQHKWCIHHNDKWIKCEGIIELLIRWLFLLQSDFQGTIHDGKNVITGWSLGKKLESQYKIFAPVLVPAAPAPPIDQEMKYN